MMKESVAALVWAGTTVVLALGSASASKLGYLDGETVVRVVVGFNGLMIVWLGNRIPKKVVPNPRLRQATRVAGWSQVLSGLIYTGLFVFAPMRVAALGGATAVLLGVVVTLGYCFRLRHEKAV